MRDDHELVTKHPYPMSAVSPLPTFDDSLEYLRGKLRVPASMSREYLFFVASCLGSRMDAYPEQARRWSIENFARYRAAGWTPDFLHEAVGARCEREERLRSYW